ncbi:DUF2971 domain-containing protein [Yersinia aleksiciae]|uniref:DUF2971 domain-containing protein n=1 Tax=Yersinia aleksiciae TaxID=263819 RepID=A0ABN4H6A0_YERAE|nr:DUF2971 domain-containing protein [Yersinia aleksiciae]AKP32796.1 hypothetical protein ACZ76_04130 [Yersinia aleksiciae]CFQ51015.1 Uncharacterised protein [Yersinia aleksiciae]HDL7776102.1 hypothetical protein [Yersinia enterocolitica]HDL7784116.1 hypothetical protein [Yersinia enterocolitica]
MENDKIYHFTTYENFVKIIKSRKIFMFNAFSMQDKQEVIAGLEISISVIDEIINSIKNNDILIDSFNCARHTINKHLDKMKAEDTSLQDIFYFYILSLCNNIHNNYLWENYASGNTGVAIEFSRSEIEGNISPYEDTKGAVNFGNREQFIRHLPGFINNEPLRQIHYKSEDYRDRLRSELQRFRDENFKDKNCSVWMQLITFNLSSSYKLTSEADYSKEEETRFLFSLSHTGAPYDLVSYFNKYLYNIDNLAVNGRRYIPLHLNPLINETAPLTFTKQDEVIMSGHYPFAYIMRIILGKENTILPEDINVFLNQNGFNNIEVTKMA